MPQQGLPFPTSNNAPLPIPGGYGNPTGVNTGGFGAIGTPFSSITPYGGGGGGTFPVPAYNAGPYTGTNLGGINSGLGFQWGKGYGSDIYNRLGTAYGKGPGQLLGDILSGGLYNPQVAAAFLNAQQPGIARGEAAIQNAFGDAGARFSSAAAIGMGDYESQVQLNQQQMLAQLYQQAQAQELSLLQNVLPTLHQERADEGGWLNKVLGGIETAAGVAMEFVPGMQGVGATLIGGGIGTMTGKGGGGGGGMMMPGMTGLPGFGGNTGTFGANAPVWGSTNPQNVGLPTTSGGVPFDPQVAPNIQQTGQVSGGAAIGGAPLPGVTNPQNPWAVPGGPWPPGFDPSATWMDPNMSGGFDPNNMWWMQ